MTYNFQVNYFGIKINKVGRVVYEEKFKCATPEIVTAQMDFL